MSESNVDTIHYEVVGAGPPVVLLHAGLTDLTMWDAQVDVLARHHRVVRYDARGHGRTPVLDHATSDVDDLTALLDHLDVGPAVLVGSSRGGAIAIDFALTHPERVRGLVAAASDLSGFDDEPLPRERALLDAINAAEEAKDFDTVIEREAELWLAAASPAVRGAVAEMSRTNYRTHPEPVEAIEIDPPAVERISDLAAPMCVMVGDRDTSWMQTIARRLSEAPNARSSLLEGASHLLPLERPVTFAAEVARFLAELGPT